MLGFLNASMASASQRFMNYYEGRKDTSVKIKIFNSSIIIHVFLALLVGTLFILLESFVFDSLLNIETERLSAAKWVYRITILSTIVSIATVPFDAIINSHEDLVFYAIIGIIEVVLKFFLALYVLVTVYDKLIVYALTIISVTLLAILTKIVYCKLKYEECIFSPSVYFDRPLIKQMLQFGGWNLIGSYATLISNYGIGIVINRFLGSVINATFSIANQYTGIMLVLCGNMLKAVNPAIVKKEGRGNRAQMFEASFTSCKMSFLTFFFIGLVTNYCPYGSTRCLHIVYNFVNSPFS